MNLFHTANATILVNDLDSAVAFYTRTLGFQLGARERGYFAQVTAAGMTLVLHPHRGAGSRLSIGMNVLDLDEVTRSLDLVSDLAFERHENPNNRFAFFVDPDGTPLYFMQPKQRG